MFVALILTREEKPEDAISMCVHGTTKDAAREAAKARFLEIYDGDSAEEVWDSIERGESVLALVVTSVD